jgi:adenosyl cobinamide kinase/adenosyl cobinamide phosphate guanylyltransferase
MRDSGYTRGDAAVVPMTPPPVKPIREPLRGIKPEVYAKYHVVHESETGSILFPYNDRRSKQLKCYKVRKAPFKSNPDKVMPLMGSPKNTSLFGYGAVSSKAAILCFGEFDAMSAHQIMGYAGISPLNDDSAAGHCLSNLPCFDDYEVVFVVPDNDKSGAETLEQLLDVLPLDKVKICKLPDDVKDVNDLLVQHREEEFKKALWAATAPQLKFLVHQSEVSKETQTLLEDPMAFIGYDTGLDAYDDLVGGVRPGELLVLGGKTSSGKSSFARFLTYQMSHQVPTLFCGYEGRREIDNLGFASLHSQKPLIYMAKAKKFEEVKAYEDIWRKESTITYVDPKICDLKTYLRNLKIAVKMNGLKCVAMDHLHYMSNAMQASGSNIKETQAIETFMLQLHEAVVDLKIAFILVSHVARNKDSKGVERTEVNVEEFHGSSAIEKYADVAAVLFGERYNIETTLRVGKVRLFGRSGDVPLIFQPYGGYK